MDDEGELRMRKTKIQESPNLTQVLGFIPLLWLLQIIPKDPTDTEYQKLCRLALFPNVPTISFYFHLVLFFFFVPLLWLVVNITSFLPIQDACHNERSK